MTQKALKRKNKEADLDSSSLEKVSKKRKSKDETITQESEHTQMDTISKKKREKKKKKRLEHDLDSSDLFPQTDSTMEGTKTTEGHKKKKKRGTDSVDKLHATTEEHSQCSNSSSLQKASKKRKSEDKTVTQDQESEHKQTDNIPTTKKENIRKKKMEPDLGAFCIIRKGAKICEEKGSSHGDMKSMKTDSIIDMVPHTDSTVEGTKTTAGNKKKKTVKNIMDSVDKFGNATTEEHSQETKKKKKNKKAKKIIEADTPRMERALQYLRTWTTNREAWKFNKMLQVCLLQMMYEKSKISDDDFNLLLPYLEGLGPMAKSQTVELAMKYLQEDSDTDETRGVRVRQLLKNLS